jgi:hypothetical protein
MAHIRGKESLKPMSATPEPPEPANRPQTGLAGMSLPKIIGGTIVLVLLTVLGTYIFGGFQGLSGGGAIALIVGVTLSFALGVGLMVAIFHSSRFYDENAHHAAQDHFKDRHRDP